MRKANRKVHLIHIQESLEIGGMENGVVNLTNNMNTDIFDISICCINRMGPLKERIKNNGVKIFDLEQGEGIAYNLPFRLRNLFKKERIDIVHTHNFYSGLYGILGAILARVPLIIHGEHGTPVLDKRIRVYVMRLLSFYIDRILTVNEPLKHDFIKKTGIPENKTEAILNGVDIDRFKNSVNTMGQKRKLGIDTNSRVIGSIGRLSPVKNYKLLLKATHLLKTRGDGLICIFVGDGPCKEELMRLADNYKVNAMFLGERDDIPEMLSIMDVFVLTSLNEGMSNTILEAMAAAKPVVATDVGGNKELIDNDITGFLVPSGDEEELSKKINIILEDKELAISMGLKGKQKVEQKFSLNRMVKDYENLYYNLLESKGML